MNEKIQLESVDERVNDDRKKEKLAKLMNRKNNSVSGDGNRMANAKTKMKTENSEAKTSAQSRVNFVENNLSNNMQNHSNIKTRKPKLNTNLPNITFSEIVKSSIRKISVDKSITPSQKIERLKAIEISYIGKNNPEAIDVLTELSLVKADLFLKC